ncbi:hypothetical protein ACHAQH_003531 [Verticillium albo-atrum]
MDPIEQFNAGMISFDFEDVTFHPDEIVEEGASSPVLSPTAASMETPIALTLTPEPVAKRVQRRPPPPILIPRATSMEGSVLVSGSAPIFPQALRNGVAGGMSRTGKITDQACHNNVTSFSMPQAATIQECITVASSPQIQSPCSANETSNSTPEMGRCENTGKASKKPTKGKKKVRKSVDNTTAAERQQALLKSLAESEAARARKNADAINAPPAPMGQAPTRSPSLGKQGPMRRTASNPIRGHHIAHDTVQSMGQVAYLEDPFVNSNIQEHSGDNIGPGQRRGSITSNPSPQHSTPSKGLRPSPHTFSGPRSGSHGSVRGYPQPIARSSSYYGSSPLHGHASSPVLAPTPENLYSQQQTNNQHFYGWVQNQYIGQPMRLSSNNLPASLSARRDQAMRQGPNSAHEMDMHNLNAVLDPRLREPIQPRAPTSFFDGPTDAELNGMGFVRTNVLSTAETSRLGIKSTPPYTHSNVSAWIQQVSPTNSSSGSCSGPSPLKRQLTETLESDITDDKTDLTGPSNGEESIRRTSKKRKSGKASCLDLFSSTADQPAPVMTAAMRNALAAQGGDTIPVASTPAPVVAAPGVPMKKPSGQVDMMEMFMKVQEEQNRFQEQQRAAQEAFQLRIQQMMQGRGGHAGQ